MAVDDLVLQHAVEQLLYREAYLLDLRRWDDWLALYVADAEYYVPAWLSEDELASDPARELSLIYLKGKGRIDDRAFRIRGGDSYASAPLPRSCHVVGNVLVLAAEGETIDVAASWTVHQYGIKGARTHGGRYDYRLRRVDGDLKIAKKTIIFLNDRIDIPIDVYNI